jgi:hypothetical protein
MLKITKKQIIIWGLHNGYKLRTLEPHRCQLQKTKEVYLSADTLMNRVNVHQIYLCNLSATCLLCGIFSNDERRSTKVGGEHHGV